MNEAKIVEGRESEPATRSATQEAKVASQGTEEARWNHIADIANLLLAISAGIVLLLVSGFCYLLALGYADMAVPYR